MCYVSLGSNIGDTEDNLHEALIKLEDYGDEIRLKAVSEYYETEPQGEVKDQPWFTNQIIALEIDAEIWSPQGFLSTCTAIEAKMGRERAEKGGPRPLDMDIVAWGDVTMDIDFLTLPHPRAKERAFVLIPLKEIAPDYVFPDGTTIDEALSAIEYTLEGRKIWQKA
ncbi:2-amino-4-hydroxy-6-hydroxymethyldihydropteridine diphosphokinase [uncultured Pseudodesulfovibrio sp.]|uniref:2-amino-4-hydroxy-6- hydroxymethyldihydropteridine diphosphokinase n=1 Tax=uncultured Pseudodesulfovibrio sp. TaxID=2035858 RepID=UPI0029C7AAED|nr:2-amino-4-hydroxy-6-hydroxymethyldihydropteridine diphosphokinase [uncultured Pseudodesulfovibrio sp.]